MSATARVQMPQGGGVLDALIVKIAGVEVARYARQELPQWPGTVRLSAATRAMLDAQVLQHCMIKRAKRKTAKGELAMAHECAQAMADRECRKWATEHECRAAHAAVRIGAHLGRMIRAAGFKP